jgi:hypothetical protein
MNLKLTSRKEMERLGKKYGIPPLPKDHPYYSEGPSITFSSGTPKQHWFLMECTVDDLSPAYE